MRTLELPTHYGRTADVDVCAHCHLAWFDGMESVNLAGRGVLELLRAIQASHGGLHNPLVAQPKCPRCGTQLKWAQNLTMHGPTAHHECPRGHGALQSFSLYLAEKGFVRPLFRPEMEQLRKRPEDRQDFLCVNCGGKLDARHRDACSFCGSPVKVVDLPRLVRAVDRQTGAAAKADLPAPAARPVPLACSKCGGAVDALRERRCSHCAMPIVVTDLAHALSVIEPFVPAIEQGAPTSEHLSVRLAESLDTQPRLPKFGRRHFLETQWWIYFAGAIFMVGVGLLLVNSSR